MTRTPSLLEGDRMSMVRSIALTFLGEFAQRGMRTQVVLPDLDDRFFVSLFGRDVPAPKSRFRWWALQLNIEQLHRALLRPRRGDSRPRGRRAGSALTEAATGELHGSYPGATLD